MRMRLKVPALEYLGMAIYPKDLYDIPIFYFDLSYTKKKAIAYINFIRMHDGDAYYNKYIGPLKDIHEKYKHVPCRNYPEWMTKYTSDYTVYAMPSRDYLETLKACGLDYLGHYLALLGSVEKIQEDQYRQQTAKSQKSFINELIRNDITVKMLGKIVGKKKARRIFDTVLT